MHEHDRTFHRAGIERIELMEVCPVCGEQRRDSARFCTTCGHRFATDEIVSAPFLPAAPATEPEPDDSSDPVISGWPAPASPVAASPWAPSPEDRGGWPAPPAAGEENSDASEVTWAEVAATAFSAPSHAHPVTGSLPESDAIAEFEAMDYVDAVPAQFDVKDNDLLRQRARSLMDELGEVIEGLTGEASTANDDLASELEISLTRPAALEGDALSDLLAAAESAQARPRDLDTLTALTAQAETILAVIVGYERATAGIERAIASLRSRPSHREE